MPDVDDFDFRRQLAEESRYSAADHEPGEVAARLAREEAIEKAAEIVRGFGLPGFGRKIGTALADAGLLVIPPTVDLTRVTAYVWLDPVTGGHLMLSPQDVSLVMQEDAERDEAIRAEAQS